MSKLSTFLNKCFLFCDMFGINFTFLVNDKTTLKTSMGASLSLFYITTLIGLFFGFGVDLYERKSPKVSLNSETQPYSRTQMSNSNFTFAYRIESRDGVVFYDETIVYTKIYYWAFENVDGAWVNNVYEVKQQKKCGELPHYAEKEAYYNFSLKNWFCVDFDNLTWGGYSDANFLYNVEIAVEQCVNSTFNNNFCATKEVIENSFYDENNSSNLYFSDLTINLQAQMNNYETPLKSTLVNNFQLLDINLTKIKSTKFKTSTIENDVGWFYSDVKQESIINLDTSVPDFTLKDKWGQNLLYFSDNYLGNKVETYHRQYTKIQEVIANVGGFSKIMYILIGLFYSLFETTYRNITMINKIQFNEDKLNHEKNKKLKIPESKPKGMTANLKDEIHTIEIKKQPPSIMKPKISYLKYFCYHKMKKQTYANNLNQILERYPNYSQYFTKKMRLNSYLNLYHEFKILKDVLLSNQQQKMFRLIKPCLKTESSKQDKDRYSEVLNTFSNEINTTNNFFLDDRMKGMIGLLEEDLKNYITNISIN